MGGSDKISRALCPSGTKATGCGLSMESGSWVYQGNPEMWPDVYPFDDTVSSESGCECYSVTPNTCYAACSPDITDYWIPPPVKERWSNGKTYASCHNEPGNPKEQRLLLGCGLRHPVKKNVNWYHAAFFVKNATHCECVDYNSDQYECYAICGNIQKKSAKLGGGGEVEVYVECRVGPADL